MVWHKVSEMIGKPNRLSFTRAELDKVLNSSDYAPEASEIAIASIDNKGSCQVIVNRILEWLAF